jgi:hypothetical protein
LAVNISFKIYSEIQASKKTVAWWNQVVTILRRDWRPFVNLIRCTENKQLLFSKQDMSNIRDSFKDKKFKATTDFIPIGIMDNILKGMIEDILKNPPRSEVRATDPSAIDLMEKDMMMLKARKTINGDLSKYQNQVGLPKYKLSTKDNFNSNVGDFDKMGLNENDEEDTTFFSQNYQRLLSTISLQSALNSIMKLNRFDEDKARKFVIDILSNNVITCQTMVAKITGEIKYNYIYPETAYSISNDSNDGHNDICKGWQDSKTVPEFLEMAGDDFDFNTDWPKLLWAINYFSGIKYTGFKYNNNTFETVGNGPLAERAGLTGDEQSNIIDWTLAYTYKVYCGYMEANTVEATGNYVVKRDTIYDNNVPSSSVNIVSYDYELSKKEAQTGYQKETYYQQQWYGSYFLATTSVTQWIFGYGKVYYQNIYGANDEYAAGTLHYYRYEGQSAVEIAKPIIDFVNFCYYRMKWIVWHAKPEEDQVVLEELVQISKGMQKLYNQQSTNKIAPTIDNILNDLIKYQRENFVRIRAFPQIEGKTIAQLPPLDGKQNGVDKIAGAMQSLLIWGESFVSHLIGWNPMRSGANPQSRESFKSEQATLQASYNTTGFVYRSIQFLKERVATSTLMYIQDIINFRDTIPYNWLKKLLGNEQFDNLDLLGEYAAHRYGIFTQDYNTEIERQEVMQAANLALQQKMLTFDAWFIVTQTTDIKLAAKTISYKEYKAMKKARQQSLQDKQIEDQMAKNRAEEQKMLLDTEGGWKVKVGQLALEAAKYTADQNKDAKIVTKDMQIKAEPDKVAAKTQGGQELAETKENVKHRQPFPA